MIEIEVNSQPYTNFISASAEIRLDALTNTFIFVASADKNESLPFTGNEPCRILVDGEPQITGFIEIVEINYSSQSHTITIQGRGKTAGLIDSTLDSLSDIRPPIGLRGIIQKVIDQIGLDIKIIEETSTELFNESEDLAGPEPGENAFEFIEKFSRKRQVLLTENGDGNLVITQSSNERFGINLTNIIGNPDNNILSANFSYDYTGRYNFYKFVSAQNPIPLINAGETDLTSLVDQGGGVRDPASRVGRQLILVAESPYSNAECEKRSRWEANIRKTRSRVYIATVDGFRADNELWRVNRLVNIRDDFCKVDGSMLINTVTFDYNNDDGSLTTLGFVESNSYTLEFSEPKVDKTGLGIFS